MKAKIRLIQPADIVIIASLCSAMGSTWMERGNLEGLYMEGIMHAMGIKEPHGELAHHACQIANTVTKHKLPYKEVWLIAEAMILSGEIFALR